MNVDSGISPSRKAEMTEECVISPIRRTPENAEDRLITPLRRTPEMPEDRINSHLRRAADSPEVGVISPPRRSAEHQHCEVGRVARVVERMKMAVAVWKDAEVLVYGSTANGFGEAGADIDMTVQVRFSEL
jgi:hypothetical protein